jgi:hypothetical protein
LLELVQVCIGEKIMQKHKLTSLFLLTAFILTLVSGCTYDYDELAIPAIPEYITNITETEEDITNPTHTVKSATKSNAANTFQPPLEIVPDNYISNTNLTVQPKKAYTILVYMNGSDLESEYMAATIDLNEMINSRFDDKNINLIIFTGGARRWHTRGIPNNNAIFKMQNGRLTKLAQLGKDPMGYPEVLSGFINFAYNLFPADKYGLIFWNHGGGAIVGYGSDERFRNPNKAMMKLSEIDSSLGNSDICKNDEKFEFIGFDTCLMATLEMACIASNYADYMIASEELEPDGGWDYTFLREIKPETSGKEAGILIADYYYNYYMNYDFQDIITISLTDLSQINEVAHYFEKLAIAGRNEIVNGRYNLISRARSLNRAFGSRGEFADETDMIDAANLAKSLRKILPEESIALINAINNAVIYKRETNIENLGGLSVYFPFANKNNLNYNMEVYRSINRLPEYVNFIHNFCIVLDSRPLVNYRGIVGRDALGTPSQKSDENQKITLTPEQLENLAGVHQTTWKKYVGDGAINEQSSFHVPYNNRYIQIAETKKVNVKEDGTVEMNFSSDCTTLNGHLVCLYETAPLADGARYSIPVKLNGEDADLIAIYSKKYPDGKIIGAVPSGDDIYNILDKKIVRLRNGDKIQILYYAESFGETEFMDDGKDELWQKGEEFIVESDLILRKEPLKEGEYIYGLNFVDLQQNKYYSNFLSVGIK